MPLSMIGREPSKMNSSRSVCSMRVAKPLPVASAASASANHAGTLDRLSNASTHELLGRHHKVAIVLRHCANRRGARIDKRADHPREHRLAGAVLTVEHEHRIRPAFPSAATSHATPT